MKHIFLFIFLATSQLFAKNINTLQVKENTVPCVGGVEQECLQVKIDKDWVNFYDKIEGFNYEPGYVYKLKVIRQTRKQVAADQGKYTYKLKKIVSKKKVEGQANFEDKKWVLVQMNDKEIQTQAVYLQFESATHRVFGTTGCNRFNAEYSVKSNDINLKMGLSTMMVCEDEMMLLESKFLSQLNTGKLNYKFNKGELVLTTDKGSMRFKEQTAQDKIAFLEGKELKIYALENVGKDYGKAFLKFENGKVSGHTGCNNIMGTYTIDEDVVTISNLGTTRMACPNTEAAETEAKLIKLLSGKRLQLDVEDQVLVFKNEGLRVLSLGK